VHGSDNDLSADLYIEENENFELLNPCVVSNRKELLENEDADVTFERVKENLS